MNSSTQKLIDKAIVDFEQLYGKQVKRKDADTIRRVFDAHVKSKISNYYTTYNDLSSIGPSILDDINSDPDSKAEVIFRDFLRDNDVQYKFQYKIGQYRADFLIRDILVFELDGPIHLKQKDYDQKRDAFIRKMGYKVLRVPLWLISISPKAVIEEIDGICDQCRGKY